MKCYILWRLTWNKTKIVNKLSRVRSTDWKSALMVGPKLHKTKIYQMWVSDRWQWMKTVKSMSNRCVISRLVSDYFQWSMSNWWIIIDSDSDFLLLCTIYIVSKTFQSSESHWLHRLVINQLHLLIIYNIHKLAVIYRSASVEVKHGSLPRLPITS